MCCSLSHTAKKDLESPNEEWGVDQQLISKLKEKYKNERKGKKTSKLPCLSWTCIYTTEKNTASLLRWQASFRLTVYFYFYFLAYLYVCIIVTGHSHIASLSANFFSPKDRVCVFFFLLDGFRYCDTLSLCSDQLNRVT